jgi:hypothetical protein
VHGFIFNAENLSWRLPQEKISKTLRVITDIESKSKVTLLEMQQLMGNLNHVGQMCPFFLNLTFALT